jgi:hypothetical protein
MSTIIMIIITFLMAHFGLDLVMSIDSSTGRQWGVVFLLAAIWGSWGVWGDWMTRNK